MQAFKRRGQAVEAHLDNTEITIVAQLIVEFAQLSRQIDQGTDDDIFGAVTGDNDTFAWRDDPALARLFPDAYRNDKAASTDFLRYTCAEQAAEKMRAATTVAEDLGDADDGWVTVPPGHIDDWLVTMTNLRLVLAARLGIEHDGDVERLTDGNGLAEVFNWFGWMQESLLTAL